MLIDDISQEIVIVGRLYSEATSVTNPSQPDNGSFESKHDSTRVE